MSNGWRRFMERIRGLLHAVSILLRGEGYKGMAEPPSTQKARSETEHSSLQTPLETIKAWSLYAKERFDSEEARIVDFRNWGRQLAAAVAVVIAFEVNAMTQVVINGAGIERLVRAGVLVLFGFALWRQARALTRSLRIGYLGQTLTGPESPAKLGEFILGKEEWEAQRLIGAYYAKAFEQFYELAQDLSSQVAAASKEFRKSLRPLLGALLLLVGGLFAGQAVDTIWPHERIEKGLPAAATPAAGKPTAEDTVAGEVGNARREGHGESMSQPTKGPGAMGVQVQATETPSVQTEKAATPQAQGDVKTSDEAPVAEIQQLLDTPTKGLSTDRAMLASGAREVSGWQNILKELNRK